jgi:UDP-N-acetylmuramyl pentapeptide phosphotransferase/UDP-N-acetylglucosamine-1-phosphate transferase
MNTLVRTPLIAGVVTISGSWLSAWLVQHVEMAAPLRLLVAFLPAPLFLWFILAELDTLRRLDEFHRRVMLDALAMAFPAVILGAVTIDALQKGGFVTDWSVGDVWPFMALLWVPSLWLAYRRYRRNE